jgi:cell wall-associated NlpC family hydrolase
MEGERQPHMNGTRLRSETSTPANGTPTSADSVAEQPVSRPTGRTVGHDALTGERQVSSRGPVPRRPPASGRLEGGGSSPTGARPAPSVGPGMGVLPATRRGGSGGPGTGKGGVARTAIKAGVKGAVRGGATGATGGAVGAAAGAALGAAKAAGKAVLREHPGRVAAVLAIPLLLPPLALFLLVGAMTNLTSSVSQRANVASAATATASIGASTTLVGTLEAAATQTGTPWQVLLALIYYESGPGISVSQSEGVCPQGSTVPYCPPLAAASAGNGTSGGGSGSTSTTTTAAGPTQQSIGPYQILLSAVPTAAERSQANQIGPSSMLIASDLSRLLAAEPGWSNTLTLLSGVTFYQDGSPPSLDPNSQSATTFRNDFLDALSKLPVANQGPTFDANVLSLAQDWAMGVTPTPGALTGGQVSCGVASGTTFKIGAPGGATMTLDAAQISNAAIIATEAKHLTISTPGIVIAVMTGLQESSLYDLPNSKVPGSETDPNAQWGGYSPSNPPHNGTSVGVFQQQNNWGSVAQRMNVGESAKLFFERMLAIQNWQSLPPGSVAQDVQASAFPFAYTKWQGTATGIVDHVLGISCTGGSGTVSVLGDSPQAKKVILAAEAEVGKPYVWGGGTPTGPSGSATAPPADVGQPGFDCSGLVLYAFAQVGIALPHYSGIGGQYSAVLNAGQFTANPSQLQPGDLVFFAGSDGTMANPGHVGIYVGSGKMIDAPYTGALVRVDRVDTGPGSGFVGGGPV